MPLDTIARGGETTTPEISVPGRLIVPDGPIPRPVARSPPRPPKSALARVSEGRPPDGAGKPRDRSKGEAGDLYPGALFRVPGTPWRVAVCHEGRQWILQQREARDHWVGRKYFSNKQRLAVVLRELVSPAAYRAIEPQIAALPI